MSAPTNTYADSEYAVTQIAADLGIPWGMAWLSPKSIIVTDRSGKVNRLDTDSGKTQAISGAPEVWARGQGGLLDVATNGQYQAGDWLYFSYSKPTKEGAATTLARAKLSGNALTDWQDLLVTDSSSDKRVHFGGRIAIKDGFIYMGVGDRGNRPNGQNLNTHAGKILRVALDGTTPESNPFTKQGKAKAEIWSYGHRNPQGLCFDNRNRLWESEHGPRGGDEINLIEAGGNYGWATVSYGKEYHSPAAVGEATEKPGMVSPKEVYIPSIAPGSLLCYHNTETAWANRLFLGALKLQHLSWVAIYDDLSVTDAQQLLSDQGYRIRSLLEDHNGDIIFAVDGGQVYRYTPTDK
ncbi:PQQ-dependent sugar dehydrogenase [Halioxenophilus aromaticivorans]|uniref:PQQ-dependent sugar dehydrogenase n=1 Tax=Halioxenophilus aromaticivorans TaxID=1306992 RepID=UPI0031EF5ED6